MSQVLRQLLLRELTMAVEYLNGIQKYSIKYCELFYVVLGVRSRTFASYVFELRTLVSNLVSRD